MEARNHALWRCAKERMKEGRVGGATGGLWFSFKRCKLVGWNDDGDGDVDGVSDG